MFSFTAPNYVHENKRSICGISPIITWKFKFSIIYVAPVRVCVFFARLFINQEITYLTVNN